MYGSDLSVPLSNNLYSQLEKIISAEQIKCIEEVESFTQRAMAEGSSFDENLKASYPIVELWESLDFFKRHNLFTGADKLF